ncbi:MAG: T9SS type A sorting domain-containing protein, partial [Mediterranea sp.]|nr:T9SS type A sorting domain-containing protein [Mediterranea sp.]
SERFIRLNLSDQGKNTVDKSYILLKGQYSDGYQVGEDAIKMFNPNTLQLWSKLGEEDLFVNALSEEGEKEIPLGISVPSAGNYTFSLNDLSDLVHSATLLDKYNEQTIDVLSEDYSFHAQGPANITDRFVLFLKDAPISVDPAHLSSIIAYADHSILTVKNIDEGDFIQVVDITGRIVHSGVTSQTGVYTTPIAEKGVYIVTVKGKQNAVIKVLNK